jgi:hypothetical protein
MQNTVKGNIRCGIFSTIIRIPYKMRLDENDAAVCRAAICRAAICRSDYKTTDLKTKTKAISVLYKRKMFSEIRLGQ